MTALQRGHLTYLITRKTDRVSPSLDARLAQAASLLTENGDRGSVQNSAPKAEELGSSLPPIQSPPQSHAYTTNQRVDPAHLHPQLRAPTNPLPSPSMMQAGVPATSDQAGGLPGPSTSVMSASGMGGSGSDGEPTTDGRKAKRELSQSKRAAQNRAAQRAFRQRKEHYIKKLEQQVRDYSEMEHNYKMIQAEHYSLREYVIQLQSRLIELHSEIPPPPPNVNLGQPPAAAQGGQTARAAQPSLVPSRTLEHPPVPPLAQSLEAVAQAVAGLTRADASRSSGGADPFLRPGFKAENRSEADEARTADEIKRQLQQEGNQESRAS